MSSSAFFAKPEYVVVAPSVDRAAPPQAKRAKNAKRDVRFQDSDSSYSNASVGYESDGGYVTDKIHYARHGKDDSGRVT